MTKYKNVEKLKTDLIKEIKKVKTMKHMAAFLQELSFQVLKMGVGQVKKK